MPILNRLKVPICNHIIPQVDEMCENIPTDLVLIGEDTCGNVFWCQKCGTVVSTKYNIETKTIEENGISIPLILPYLTIFSQRKLIHPYLLQQKYR